MSTVQPTDKVLVQRATTLHSASADMSTIQDTDLILVNRAGVDYKCTFADWKASQSKPPAIASVTLADSPEAGRFTSGTFRSTVVMTDEGIPASTKGIKAKVQGTLQVTFKSDLITNVATVSGDVNTIIPHTNTLPKSATIASMTASNGVTAIATADADGVFFIDGSLSLKFVSVGGESINQVTFGGGYFYAVSNTGNVYRSPTGEVWTKMGNIAGLITTSTPGGVAYCSGTLVVCFTTIAPASTAIIVHSTDGGATFTQVFSGHLPFQITGGLAEGNCKYLLWTGKNLLAQGAGTTQALYSHDLGRTWLRSTIPSAGGSTPTYISTTDGLGVVVQGGAAPNVLRISTDHGETFAAVTYGGSLYCISATFVNGVLFIDGYDGYAAVPVADVIRTKVVTGRTVAGWTASRFVTIGGSAVTMQKTTHREVKVGYDILTFQSDAGWPNFSIGDAAEQENKLAAGQIFEKSSTAPWTMKVGTSQVFTVGQRLVRPPQVVGNTTLYCKLNAGLTVTDLVSADPGFTAVTGAGPYTVTFPATLPSGKAPDVDIPAGTSLTTEVQAVNASATVSKTSNTVVPA